MPVFVSVALTYLRSHQRDTFVTRSAGLHAACGHHSVSAGCFFVDLSNWLFPGPEPALLER
jgi:hypothetical protein